METANTRAEPATAELCLPAHLLRPRLRRPEASAYLDLRHGITVAPATLAKLASVGGGPAYQRLGNTALYPTDELDRWAIERLGNLRHIASQPGQDQHVV